MPKKPMTDSIFTASPRSMPIVVVRRATRRLTMPTVTIHIRPRPTPMNQVRGSRTSLPTVQGLLYSAMAFWLARISSALMGSLSGALPTSSGVTLHQKIQMMP